MLSVAVLMDPIGAIKVAKDTTFAMLLEAQRRGHALLLHGTGRPGPAGRRALRATGPLDRT